MPRRARSRAARALAVAAALAAALSVLAAGGTAGAAARPRPVPPRVLRHQRAVRAVAPWTVSIPAIGVHARLVTLGVPVTMAGSAGLLLPVPSLTMADDAGWYPFTAVPGAAGNAVIAGHVDTYAGPAVFYNLYRLRPGNLVTVTAGGARQRFLVTSVRELAKPDFPVSRVFGVTGKHTLWLITCGGDFDHETGHYLDNIVVSAAWAPLRKTAAKRHDRQIVRIKHAKRGRW